MKTYWVSTNKLTGRVDVDDGGTIVSCAPCFFRYRGRKFAHMEAWREYALFECAIEELPPMRQCVNCHKTYPDRLFGSNSMATNPLCPICGLKIRNKFHGLPLDTPFQGPVAARMWQEAVEYDKRREKPDA